MKTNRDIAVALIILCTGVIMTALFLSYNNSNNITTNTLLSTNTFQYSDYSNTKQENIKASLPNTQIASKFNYAVDATSNHIVNTFPGKKSTEITYQPPCSESDINQSDDYNSKSSDTAELNIFRQISKAGPAKTGLIVTIVLIIFCLLTEFFIGFIKSLKREHQQQH